MDTKMLSTVLLFTFAEELEELIEELSKKYCTGCQCDHPSQIRHECLMDSAIEKLNKHFENAFQSFKYVNILLRFIQNSRKLFVSEEDKQMYFIKNVIFLDKLKSSAMKETAYRLMERKIKLEERFEH